MIAMEEKKSNKKKIIIIGIVLLLLALAAYFLFIKDGGAISFAPTVTIETPERKSVSDKDEFSLAVTLSDLKDELYPAASFSINFDSNKLEFLGLEEGNVLVPCEEKANGATSTLPDWGVNVERSNETGQINIMYLDLSGGRYAFTRELLPDGDKVLFRLKFKLRGSVQSGDIIELSFADAVFAANDEKDSLGMTERTLAVRSGRVVVGD